MTEEQVIDVVAEEVTEQPTPTVFEHETVVEEQPVEETVEEQPTIQTYIDAYVKHKKREYKHKQIQRQIKNNEKALRGFGYEYKPLTIADFNGVTYDSDDFSPL
jgi:hypothetical protein